jgi:hypothetical protein
LRALHTLRRVNGPGGETKTLREAATPARLREAPFQSLNNWVIIIIGIYWYRDRIPDRDARSPRSMV